MTVPQRNHPCPCGSGKKYKKCHLMADEAAGRAKAADSEPHRDLGDPLHRQLSQKVLEATKKAHDREDFREATRLFFDQEPGEIEPNDEETNRFFEWYIRDFRDSTGQTGVEHYLESRGGRLTARECDMLESWRAARFGVFEVEQVEEGRGVHLKDVCVGDRFFVHDVSTSRTVVRWDCVISRVEEFEGRRLFGGNGTLIPRALLPAVMEFIECESRVAGQTSADFVRANSHRLHRTITELHRERFDNLKMVNREGDPIEFSSAHYAVKDETALLAALPLVEGFQDETSTEDEPGSHHFGWLETGVEGPRTSYGSVRIHRGRLRLECNSRNRLKRGRGLLEAKAGRLLTHLDDSFQTLESVKANAGRNPPEKPARPIPPEVERDLIVQMKTEHYAKWSDTPLGALEGNTARQAVQTEAGRRAVRELIRMMENSEERQRKEGRAAFDFTPLRRTLGLEGE